MDLWDSILAVARRNDHNRRAITHVYLSRDGHAYEFDDWGHIRREYSGRMPSGRVQAPTTYMPMELEEQVEEYKRADTQTGGAQPDT